MRDVRDFSKTVTVEQRLNGSVVSSGTYTNVITRQARDDSVSTVRKNGVYCVPTDYWARFYTGNGDLFDFEAYDSLRTKRTWIGESPTNLASTLLGPNYGCSASTGLPTVPGDVKQKCVNSVRSQFMGNNWNVGTDIGELPETVRFIHDTLKSFLRLLGALATRNPGKAFDAALAILGSSGKKALRRNKRSLAKAVAKGGSSAFLAYKFAWLPLLSSVHDAVNLASNGLNRPTSFQAHASDGFDLPEPAPRPGTTFLDKSWQSEGEFTVHISYRLSSPALFDLTQLGLLNPISVAWELVPLSFVIDWFIPVGNFLSAIQAPIGLEFASGYETTYLKWSYHAKYMPFGAVTFIKGSVMSCRANLTSFNRGTLVGFPVPVPHFRGPGSFNMSKTLSLLTLAVQKL